MLFSNTFLENRLKLEPNYLPDLGLIFIQVHTLYVNARKHGAQWTEEETEKFFVQPVLDVLQWSFAVQVKSRDIGNVTHPDYTLFMDALSHALGVKEGAASSEYYHRALAIAEAKHWGRPLDMRGESSQGVWKAQANPDHQMIGYLRASGVAWGVLTNGQVWRLYHQSLSSKAIEYFEFNLADIFGDLRLKDAPKLKQLTQFCVWWQIFRRDAFVPDGSGATQAARLLEEYNDYQLGMKNRLIERITEYVIPALAEGILVDRYQRYGTGGEARIDVNKLTSVIVNLIYRMLFLFVAEHKGMLPGNARDKDGASLCALAKMVSSKKNPSQNIYSSLLQLFQRIYYGDVEKNTPAYRGGLFDPSSEDLVFLTSHDLPDPIMRKVFTALTIDGETSVDYDCIESYHLSDIANALLDMWIDFVQLSYDRRALKVRSGRSRQSTQHTNTTVKVDNPTIEYLIHQSLASIIDENGKRFIAAMDNIATIKARNMDDTQAITAESIFTDLEEANRSAVDSFLSLKVLDPAMGAGTCLIGIIQYLSDEIISRMQIYHDVHPDVPWDWNPIYVLLDQERMRSQARVSRYGLVIDADLFGDTRLLKRLITLRCIYGVDPNQVAVDFSKHNLWLAAFTVGAPFSFLDHHIRCGNSILGTRLSDASAMHKQQLYDYISTGVSQVLNRVYTIKSELDAGRWTLQTQDSLQYAFNPYKSALDVFILAELGNPLAVSILNRHNVDINAIVADPEIQKLDATNLFHWELEFPDVFWDEKETNMDQALGFDVIICVPGYYATAIDDEKVLTYLQARYPRIAQLNQPHWFLFAQCLRLLCSTGNIAMVIDRRVFVTRPGQLDAVLDSLGIT